MRAQKDPGDRAVAELATRQHGVITRGQLVALGLGRKAIQHRLAVGRLHSIHRGVYAPGHSAIRPQGRLMAAVLACGPDALLSHRSAADLWGLRATARARIDVTAPGRSRHARSGIDLHRVRQLHADDRAERDSIPITSIARTLLDLAEVVPDRELERAFDEAERSRLLDVGAVDELCRRSRGRRGLRSLGVLVREARPPAPATRSELERRFLELCRAAGLPRPGVNLFVAGYDVDMVWPDRRLVVELDSHAFHGTRAAFERDRIRDAALQLAGYRVLRLTHRRLETDSVAALEAVRSLL